MFLFVRFDEQLPRLKVWANEGISFMCCINCTLRETSILQGRLLLHISVCVNTFCHTVCCMYVQLNRQCCESHGTVKISIIWYMLHKPSIRGNRAIAAPTNFSKICLDVRYNNKFQSVCLPPENMSWLPPWCHVYVFREGSKSRPTSTRSEDPCWQKELECEWKTSEL